MMTQDQMQVLYDTAHAEIRESLEHYRNTQPDGRVRSQMRGAANGCLRRLLAAERLSSDQLHLKADLGFHLDHFDLCITVSGSLGYMFEAASQPKPERSGLRPFNPLWG